MKKNIATAFLLVVLSAGMVFGGDDFAVDLDGKAVRNNYSVYTVGDLGVGEFAIIRSSADMCRAGNMLKLPKSTEVVSKRSEYFDHYKVTREPGDKIRIVVLPAKSGSLSKSIKKIALSITDKRHSCSLQERFLGYTDKDYLVVKAIGKASSLSALLKKFP